MHFMIVRIWVWFILWLLLLLCFMQQQRTGGGRTTTTSQLHEMSIASISKLFIKPDLTLKLSIGKLSLHIVTCMHKQQWLLWDFKAGESYGSKMIESSPNHDSHIIKLLSWWCFSPVRSFLTILYLVLRFSAIIRGCNIAMVLPLSKNIYEMIMQLIVDWLLWLFT